MGKLEVKAESPMFLQLFLFHIPPHVFPSEGAELKCGVGCPQKELSNSHGENVLILKGSKEHQ